MTVQNTPFTKTNPRSVHTTSRRCQPRLENLRPSIFANVTNRIDRAQTSARAQITGGGGTEIATSCSPRAGAETLHFALGRRTWIVTYHTARRHVGECARDAAGGGYLHTFTISPVSSVREAAQRSCAHCYWLRNRLAREILSILPPLYVSTIVIRSDHKFLPATVVAIGDVIIQALNWARPEAAGGRDY
ncbi:hypothetical protein ACJJTC_007305 [Scirpophaga incertulas]